MTHPDPITKRADHLGWRWPEPGDDDLEGLPIPGGYRVFYVLRTGKQVEQSHLDQYRAVGRWRKQSGRGGKLIGGKRYPTYWSRPFYVADGNAVRQGTLYMHTDPTLPPEHRLSVA